MLPPLLLISFAAVVSGGFLPAGSAEGREIYLVQVEGGETTVVDDPGESAPVGRGEGGATIAAFHDQLLRRRLDAGTYRKLYTFHHLLNGFAVHTTPSQADTLAAAPEVKMVERDRGARLMTTHTPAFMGLPAVWAQAAAGGRGADAGDGIVVGVVDTGIDPAHPSFAYDCGGVARRFSGACDVGPSFPRGSCNGKIVAARRFSAGAAAVLPPDPSREWSPIDEVGHGTHVASIAAGNRRVPVVVDGFQYGVASGMAPGARIAAYKAVYPEGGTLADVVSAIDQAVQDGVDVLVLSVGPAEPPRGGIQAVLGMFEIATLFARRAGVLVVQAAGNNGPAGEATVVSVSPWAVAVAASTTDRRFQNSLVLDDGTRLPGAGLTGPTFGGGLLRFKLVAAKDAAAGGTQGLDVAASECQGAEALRPATVEGAIVICNFSAGFLNRSSQLTSVLATAGALGFAGFVLVANPAFGDLVAQPLPFSTPGIIIPGVSDVKILLDYYERRTVRAAGGRRVLRFGGRASIGEGRAASFGRRAPAVAGFSSRGPAAVDGGATVLDVLKPDIAAPGDQIWAAWSPLSATEPILSGKSFALLSGTSMAAPHVAGVAALIRQLRPSWDASEIASAIASTASRQDNSRLPIMAQGADLHGERPSTPFDHGAGFVNPSGALDPGLVFPSGFEDYVQFLCSLPGMEREMVRAATGAACGRRPAVPSSSSPPGPANLNLASVTVSALRGFQAVRRRVKNVGAAPETYLSAVQPPRGVDVGVHPATFTLAPRGTQDLEIRLNATRVLGGFSFGELVLVGSLGHVVRLPLSIFPRSM